MGIALGLLVAPGPTLAASSPEAAVLELLDRAAGRDLGDLDGLVCAAQQETVRNQLDPGTLLGDPSAAGGPGEPQRLAFAFTDRAVSVVSQAEDAAVVRLTATMTLDVDEGQVREYVLGLMEATDTGFSDEDLEQMVGLFTTSLATAQEVDEEIALTREGGDWVVCDDLDGDPGLDAGLDPGLDPGLEPGVSEPEGAVEVDPAGDPGPSLCDALPLADLNALGPLEYHEVAGDAGSCYYESVSEEAGFHALNMYTEVLDLEVLRQIFPEGSEVSVAGRAAYSDGTSLWVSLGERLLTIVPSFFGSPVAETVDPLEYSLRVAEVIVPRLLEAAPAE